MPEDIARLFPEAVADPPRRGESDTLPSEELSDPVPTLRAMRRDQKRQWQDDEFRRRVNEEKQTKHNMEMAKWARAQKLKAKVEQWHVQMWAESGVDAPPVVKTTPQLRPRRPPPTRGTPAHRKPPPAPSRSGVD